MVVRSFRQPGQPHVGVTRQGVLDLLRGGRHLDEPRTWHQDACGWRRGGGADGPWLPGTFRTGTSPGRSFLLRVCSPPGGLRRVFPPVSRKL